MGEVKKYQGGCHCGKIRYEFSAEITQLAECNCSICSKAGWLLTFMPAEQFTLLSGEDSLKDYQFGKKTIHHLFCSTCGVRSFGRGLGSDGKEWATVNVRCLDDFDTTGLPVQKFDGKSL